MVVENRAGAGGNIAADAVAKATPDGYTLVLLPSGHSSNAAMKKNLPFDPVNDFAWVSTVTTYPLTLSVKPNSPITSFRDFIQRVKSEPNRYTYTSVGVGTAMHLFGEWLMAESGGVATHVPFKGGTAPMMELLAGRVDVMIDTMTTTAPLFKENCAECHGDGDSRPHQNSESRPWRCGRPQSRSPARNRQSLPGWLRSGAHV